MNTFSKVLTGTLLALSIQGAFAAENTGVEHNTQAFLDALNAGTGKPMEQMTPTEARAVLSGAQSGVKLTKPLNLTIVKPAGAKGTLPVFMFFHGGGWVLGDFPTHQRLIRDLVVDSGAVAVYVDYTPSPEAHYPTAINQAYGATEWVAEHGKEIGVDSQRLAVAGKPSTARKSVSTASAWRWPATVSAATWQPWSA